MRAPLATTLLGLALLGLAPQAQDLFMEFARTGLPAMLAFLIALFFIWAMPTHYAARLLLDTDRRFRLSLVQTPDGNERCSQVSALWVPRGLGLLTFVTVLIAIGRSSINVPDLHDPASTGAVHIALIEVAALVVAGAIAFFIYVVWRPLHLELPILRLLKPLNRILAPLWRRVSPGLEDHSGSDDEVSRDMGRLLLLALFIGFVLTFVAGAENVARVFARSMAVPFILGGWLPFLSYLSGVGRTCRAPLIMLFFASVAGATFLFGDNHDVRLVDAGKQAAGKPVDVSPLALENAVSTWKAANCPDGAPCPRPIIVAAAGGASRAAFFTATVLGYLLDGKQSAKTGLNPDEVRNRLFAISGVSGGSVGAAMITAALAEAGNGAGQPCRPTSTPLWWKTEDVKSWRDCLEVLTSGDFLSADVLGFAFNDMLPFPLPLLRDRAAVLEDSWRRHFDRMIPPPSNSQCHGLDCPFLSLRPTRAHWIPLLVLNGTSEATGGRIITTLLDSTYGLSPQQCPTINEDGRCRIFVQAERFHDLLPKGSADNDVRLSTAALNSARFPFISPAGTIRDKDGIVDRIVDGGYFENYGALSAEELALAVHAYDPRLFPLVIVISNDPDDLLSPDDDATRNPTQSTSLVTKQKDKARKRISGPEPVTDIVTPIKTVVNTRTAHGLLGVAELDSALRDAFAPRSCDGFIQVRVWPEQEADGSGTSKAVSMSWWLSAPIQEHLHNQTEPVQGHPSSDNTPHLAAILEQFGDRSTCEQAAKP